MEVMKLITWLTFKIYTTIVNIIAFMCIIPAFIIYIIKYRHDFEVNDTDTVANDVVNKMIRPIYHWFGFPI